MGEFQDYVDFLLEKKENLSTEWDLDDAVEMYSDDPVVLVDTGLLDEFAR